MGMDRAGTAGLAARLFPPGSAQALAFLRAAWPRAVGADLARRTEVLACEGGTLRLRVPDARWRKVLHRMQREILGRLRGVAGGVAPRRLAFTEGPVAEAPGAATRVASKLEPRPLPLAVSQAAEAIPDPELRQRFVSAAARYLTRFS